MFGQAVDYGRNRSPFRLRASQRPSRTALDHRATVLYRPDARTRIAAHSHASCRRLKEQGSVDVPDVGHTSSCGQAVDHPQEASPSSRGSSALPRGTWVGLSQLQAENLSAQAPTNPRLQAGCRSHPALWRLGRNGARPPSRAPTVSSLSAQVRTTLFHPVLVGPNGSNGVAHICWLFLQFV